MAKSLFEIGDYVALKSDPVGWMWQILERKGKRYLVGDVGEQTSNLIKNWHDEKELEMWEDDEEDFEPDEDTEMFCDWGED